MSARPVRAVKEEISKGAFFLSLFSFRAESVPSVSLNAFSRVPAASSLAPLLIASLSFANFCLNSVRKDAALRHLC